MNSIIKRILVGLVSAIISFFIIFAVSTIAGEPHGIQAGIMGAAVMGVVGGLYVGRIFD